MIYPCDDGCQCGQDPCVSNNSFLVLDFVRGEGRHGHPGGIAGDTISLQNTTKGSMTNLRLYLATPFFAIGGALMVLSYWILGREARARFGL